MDKKTKSLLKGYIDKAEEKLSMAETLFNNKGYDDAVSRAYYTAFHAAKAVLLTEGLTTEAHQGVVNLFGLHFVKTGKFDKKFGRMLVNLKDDREDGDYEIFSAIDKEIAEEAVNEAREFLKEAKRYLEQYLPQL